MTQEEVLDIAKRVISVVAPTFRFGYYDYDDITQECWIAVIKALEKYDGLRPLSNFLYADLRNKLLNLWRNKFQRTDPPCGPCHRCHVSSLVPEHHGGDYCKKYKNWIKRNSSKKELMCPSNLDYAITSYENKHFVRTEPHSEMEFQELSELIDTRLSAKLRTTYQRMLAGEKVTPQKRQLVADEINSILEEYNGEAR